jgi:hypothetical protein
VCQAIDLVPNDDDARCPRRFWAASELGGGQWLYPHAYARSDVMHFFRHALTQPVCIGKKYILPS